MYTYIYIYIYIYTYVCQCSSRSALRRQQRLSCVQAVYPEAESGRQNSASSSGGRSRKGQRGSPRLYTSAPGVRSGRRLSLWACRLFSVSTQFRSSPRPASRQLSATKVHTISPPGPDRRGGGLPAAPPPSAEHQYSMSIYIYI